MTYTAQNPQTFYDTVVTRLSSETGKNIGDAEAPSDLTLPYAVLYPLVDDDDPEMHSTLSDAHEMTVFEWQVTSIGSTRKQAQWMQQKVRAALVGWEPSVSGLSFGLVEKSGGQGTRRDDGTQPAQFFSIDQFSVFAD